MIARDQELFKTTTPIHRELLDDIDRANPFKTRREFIEEACRNYLQALKRKSAYQQLEEACWDSAGEDILENTEWEQATLEDWK